MAEIPPWLNISPRDFIAAAEAGAQAGLTVAKMRQAAEEAATDRELRERTLQAQQDLRRWEIEQEMQMKATQLAQQGELTRAQLEARTAYNLSNLGLRQRSEADRMRLAEQNLGFRRSSEARLQEQADLAAKREQRLASIPDIGTRMRAASVLAQARDLQKMMVWLKDPTEISDAQNKIDDLNRQFESLMPAKGAGATPDFAAPFEPAAISPVTNFMQGGGTAPMPAPESLGAMFGATPPTPEVAPITPALEPITAPLPTSGVTTNAEGWITTPSGRRYRIVPPEETQAQDEYIPDEQGFKEE